MPADENLAGPVQTHRFTLLRRAQIRGGQYFNSKAGISEPVGIVCTVAPNVIVLPEQTCPFLLVRDRGIVNGWCARGNRDEQNGLAVNPKDPTEFTHRPSVIDDMFQNVTAVDEVECLVGVIDVHHVHSNVDASSAYVRGHVSVAKLGSKTSLKTALGGDVKHTARPAIEEPGPLLKVQPGQAMSFER